MNPIQPVWLFLVKNLSNVFSLIGILLTIYFGIYYIPGYIKENENQKIENTHVELMVMVQELLYNEEKVNVEDLRAMIKAKELKYDITYPGTIDELLIQSKESVYEYKFLPLDVRKRIYSKIDSLRYLDEFIKDREIDNVEKARSREFISTLFSYVITILSAVLGIVSLLVRTKKERGEEIQKEVEIQQEFNNDRLKSAFDYERLVGEALQSTKAKIETGGLDKGYDYSITTESHSFLVEVKFSSKGIHLNHDQSLRLMRTAMYHKKEIIIVTNKPPSSLVESRLRNLGKEINQKFYLVVGETLNELKPRLSDLLNNHDDKK